MIFEVKAPCMTNQDREIFMEVEDWFAYTQGTYIKVFRSCKMIHPFPNYITEKVVTVEIIYQLCSGLSQQLQKKRMSPWTSFPMQVRSYE